MTDPNSGLNSGLEADFALTETYSFNTGLIFAPKRAGFSINPTDGSPSVTEDYKVHYLQIPVTLKLFTSEIQPDIKAFFQLGFKGEIKLFDEPFNENYTLIDEFQPFDCSFYRRCRCGIWRRRKYRFLRGHLLRSRTGRYCQIIYGLKYADQQNGHVGPEDRLEVLI